jgi:hypothetical protein
LITVTFIPPIAGSSKSESRRANSNAGKSDPKRIILSGAVLRERGFFERLPIGEVGVFLVPFETLVKRDKSKSETQALLTKHHETGLLTCSLP